MNRKTADRFIVPGVFLLVLGLGNTLVGGYRVQQYNVVVTELSQISPAKTVSDASLLRRIETASRAADRSFFREQRAVAKRDLYKFVTFGGRLFLLLSIVLLAVGGFLRFRTADTSDSQKVSAN